MIRERKRRRGNEVGRARVNTSSSSAREQKARCFLPLRANALDVRDRLRAPFASVGPNSATALRDATRRDPIGRILYETPRVRSRPESFDGIAAHPSRRER